MIDKISYLFNSHPKECGETYFGHLLKAMSISFKLYVSSHMMILHGILPFIKPPLGCDTRSLIDFLESHLPENRSKDENK
tara:strand:+ start:91 stop:330 length:240 start_codon:yes stop_codon:yes gene_type:complete